MRIRRLLVLAFLLPIACTGSPSVQTQSRPGSDGPDASSWRANWPRYLLNASHTSLNAAAAAITPRNVGDLQMVWSFEAPSPTQTGQPGARFFASPTVVDGTVYIGSNTGDFFALDGTDGTMRWRQSLGWVPGHTCPARGIASTAAVQDGTVYVGGGDGRLYALDAETGDIDWSVRIVKTGGKENKGYVWGSPLVSRGKVYIGVSSNCGRPPIRGGIDAVDVRTGTIVATYATVPQDFKGGSVWSSLAADPNGQLYASTGQPQIGTPAGPAWGDSYGLVSFAPPLRRTGAWHVPQRGVKVRDWDFGASPTVWSAKGTRFFGACNKDGTFYAVRARSHRPAWQTEISGPFPRSNCLSAAVFDARTGRLYVASGRWHADEGTLVAMRAATGAIVWRRPLPGPALGSLSMDGAGVLAVPIYGDASVLLLEAKSGKPLARVDANGERVFAQPVFSDRYLFVATVSGTLSAYAVSPTPSATPASTPLATP